MQILIYVLFGSLIGIGISYLILKPKLKITKQVNENITLKNIELEKINDCLSNENSKLIDKRDNIITEINRVTNTLSSTRQQAEQTAELVYQKTMETMQEKFSIAAEHESKKFNFIKKEYNEQYLQLLEDSGKAYNYMVDNLKEKINLLNIELNDLQTKTYAAVEANKRKQEIENNDKFYKLVLSDIDLQEIKKLKEVSLYLRDTEPLNKVIWKVYYEKPYSSLIGRVVGSKPTTGIYKITNLKNGMCYVGQAANIAERWRQHIKRGLGAEAPTRNKLYPAMAEYGVENFSFEIIEICTRDKLNEREDFWQDYFKAKEFGYSIK